MRIMRSGDETFPPSRPVSISLSGLARDCKVSRVDVRRLVQDGERRAVEPGRKRDGLAIAPRLSDAVRRVVATYMLHRTHCARLAYAGIGQMSS